MTAAQIIEDKVNSVDVGTVFTIEDLELPKEWWENVRVKLSRMVIKGKIQKLSKGKYYKPKQSIFGVLKPDFYEIVKDLMYDGNGNQIGYLTGYSIWNDMSLTTQISNTIFIGSNKRYNSKKRGTHIIRFILQPNEVTKDIVPLLQILDAIRFIDKIPDTSVSESVSVLKSIIKKLGNDEIVEIVKLSEKYQPRVRAMLGAILEDIGESPQALTIMETLNPGTRYNFGLTKSNVLINKNKWNIE